MPISPNFTSIYTQRFEIDYFDCDTNAQLKIVDLCKMIQMASSTHAVLGGISFWDLQEANQSWVVYKFRVEIDRMPKWQERIDITTWIETLDGIRSVRNFEVRCKGELIASASSMWVIMNTVRRRPEMMAIAHDHFTKHEGKTSISGEFTTFDKKVDTTHLVTDMVRYSDLDMVNHVTNIKYLEWVINALKANNTAPENISIIDMHFNKELRFNQQYHIAQSTTNQKHYLINSEEGNLSFQCVIE
ncbi:acyl-ACP thioesterase [Myroides odoratimimus]|uniref:acyl-[acyl-carrier-protein] thioesterase n=1 Tax=Myroides odoratimimus TaxID=76832 RepID=UPI002578DA42|nr:acyl-ACP thioesterase domain-containing protein [Myroides odoratimimus]MDM1398124.1 acyl-ACP thioesterase [Myroides odoratimimus]